MDEDANLEEKDGETDDNLASKMVQKTPILKKRRGCD